MDAKEENIIEVEVQPSIKKSGDNRNTIKGDGD